MSAANVGDSIARGRPPLIGTRANVKAIGRPYNPHTDIALFETTRRLDCEVAQPRGIEAASLPPRASNERRHPPLAPNARRLVPREAPFPLRRAK